ncbi:hypothetical protein B9479_007785 [Cryptococcus floricola]|uniref:Uncharacterized protein n=1 Tax=Cryptococcus floricola TaxID=2591691 RepID=A0A5D3ANH5_9TREE|nr:hypothetical protein B9479_007785 [Cryptococcus floricola]
MPVDNTPQNESPQDELSSHHSSPQAQNEQPSSVETLHMEDTRASLNTFSETSSYTSFSNEDEYRSDVGLTGLTLEDDIQQLTAQGTDAIMSEMNHLPYEERVRMAREWAMSLINQAGFTILASAVTIPAGDSPPTDTQQHLDNDDAATIDDSAYDDDAASIDDSAYDDEVEFDGQASSSEEEED